MPESDGEDKKKLWIIKHPFKTAGIIVCVTALSVVGFLAWITFELFYNNACLDWRPGMTPAEKILIVLEDVNNNNSLVFINSKTGQGGRAKQIPYDNIATILLENPDCCHLYTSDTALTDNPKDWETVKKQYPNSEDEGTVLLRYTGRYRDRRTGEIKTAPAYTYTNLNLCK